MAGVGRGRASRRFRRKQGGQTGSEVVKTLYLALRDAQRAAGGKDYTITSYGKAIPTAATANSSHSYTFEFNPGDPNFKKFEYVVSVKEGKAKVVAGNIFRSLVSTSPLEGSVRWVWKLRDDKIHQRLVASKPLLCSACVIHLKKGIPAKLAWLGDASKGEFV